MAVRSLAGLAAGASLLVLAAEAKAHDHSHHPAPTTTGSSPAAPPQQPAPHDRSSMAHDHEAMDHHAAAGHAGGTEVEMATWGAQVARIFGGLEIEGRDMEERRVGVEISDVGRNITLHVGGAG